MRLRLQRRAALVLSAVVGGTLFLGAGPAAAQEGSVVGAGASDAIAGRYIIVLNSAVTPTEAANLAQQYGGTLDQAYGAALPGFSAELSAAGARRLAAHPAVESVQQDRSMRMLTDQVGPPSWGLDRIDQPDLPLSNVYTYPSTASAVHAYILDTGLRTTHADFGGRATSGYDFVDHDGDANDCNGHGTHVAGTIGGTAHGVAKGVQLVALRVLGCDGVGSYSGILAAIDWVTRNAVHPAVVNMSLGGPASSAVDDAVDASIASGVTYAVAAGNANVDACGSSPAGAANALTVGATDTADKRASFSNYGSCVDLFAPGVQIRSTSFASDSATAVMSGTSMATPHVAGAAALALSNNPSATPAQVRATLIGSARAGAINDPGSGSPNLLLQVPAAAASPAPQTPAPAPQTPAPQTPAPQTPAPAPQTPAPAPAAPPPPCYQQANDQNIGIPDLRTATSAVGIANCPGRPARALVEVTIRHPRRGDLVIELVAPNGSVKRLKAANARDRGVDVIAAYSTSVTVKTRNGVWKLRVRDTKRGYAGYIDWWRLTA